MPYSTGPNEVGVRVIKLGLIKKKGVEEKFYRPGATYFFIPVINEWHTFDTKLQNMEMTIDAQTGDRKGRDDLIFKTIDGNDISLDVIISYRLDPQKAPYVLQNVAANDGMLRETIARTIARSRPRDIFGELKTEEFYVADYRTEKSEKAKKVLNGMLNPYGIIVEKVLPKDYRFNPAYQRAIEEKKIADQLAEKNKSAAMAAAEEYKKKLEDAIGQVNEMVAKVDGEYLQAKLEADAYYEKQEMTAQAIEAEGLSEAMGVQKMAEALAGPGGEVMVKLKIAEALKGKRILLIPISGGGMDIKTTDINKLLEFYGVRKLTEGKQETKVK
jgi:regulator of protease activity HflC (stomatin/prohibitin superfamily)